MVSLHVDKLNKIQYMNRKLFKMAGIRDSFNSIFLVFNVPILFFGLLRCLHTENQNTGENVKNNVSIMLTFIQLNKSI